MTNNKQQNAVQWLIDKQMDAGIGIPKEWREQAQKMHKEEMIEFAQEVFRNRYNQITQSLGNIADDIYNETYGGNK